MCGSLAQSKLKQALIQLLLRPIEDGAYVSASVSKPRNKIYERQT
jgi:hypothetical protein